MTARERLEDLLDRPRGFDRPATIETVITGPAGALLRRVDAFDGRGRVASQGSALRPGVPNVPAREAEHRPQRPTYGPIPPEADIEHLGSVLVAGREGARFRVRFPGLAPAWLFADGRADRYELVVDLEFGRLLDVGAYRRRRLIERRQVVRFELGAPA